MTTEYPYTVAALYHFAPIADVPAIQAQLKKLCTALNLCGTLLIAPEGINGTIAGTAAHISDAVAALRALPGFAALEVKFSGAYTAPFKRMKVRRKREIVTMGTPNMDIAAHVGDYVAPEDWNTLISAPDVVVIDTRNDFEVQHGTFEHAVNPHTKSFGEFPQWLENNRAALEGKKLAMFCTGGIRCEKATAYARLHGFNDVFHLKGGILNYLEKVPQARSKWQGGCFVFDERVALGHGLEIMANGQTSALENK